MKDSDTILASIKACAARYHANGVKAAELYAQALDMEADGFGPSADWHRLLASTVAELERKA